MSSLRDAALKIEPAAVIDHWLVTVSWTLHVPYWHHETWFSEVATVHASDWNGDIGQKLIRITSDPWRVGPVPGSEAKTSPAMADHVVVERTAPPQTVPATLLDTRPRFKARFPGGQEAEAPRYDYLLVTVRVDGPTGSPLVQSSPLMRGRFESGLDQEDRVPAEQVGRR